MRSRFLIYLLLLLTSALIYPQQKKIVIKAEVENLPAGSQIYITGNTDELGNWIFNIKEPMKKISDREWKFQLTADTGDTLQFKFTRGDWSTEAVDSNGIEFPNFTYVVASDTTLVYRIPNWRDIAQQKIVITPERMANKHGYFELIEGWKYKMGDDTLWADPSFDDSKWESINPRLAKEDFEKLDWTGNIWFRNHIYVDSSFWKKPFGFDFTYSGAAEVYLNGKLLYRFGEVGNSKETEVINIDRTPKVIMFDKKEEQVLSVRYSNHSAKEVLAHNFSVGFSAYLRDLDSFISQTLQIVRQLSIQQFAFGAFIFAFAIMHLLLFVFYPKSRENLFYSISMFGFAAVIFTANQPYFDSTIKQILISSTINSVAIQLSLIFGLLTVYASSYKRMPRQFVLFVFLSLIFLIQTIFFQTLLESVFNYAFYGYAIAVLFELFRVVIISIYRKDPWGWGWIIGIGFIVAMILIAYQLLIITGVITQPLFGIRMVYVYGIVFLAVTVSINLSKKVSDTNIDLEKQLVHVKELSQKAIEQERKAKEIEFTRRLLEADNERKTRELEEARKLQISMLPANVPAVLNLDISVYMKPATEVGGDYYDFKYNNGSLFIAVGDATGHGMKAGTIVATIKGLFTAESFNSEIVQFMDKTNEVIRDMNMGNLFMAFLIAKINENKLTLSSAGMPPALLYSNKKKNVEEIRLQALPLGGTAGFKYSQLEIPIFPGDTLLLMSDGFPELFNEQKEILDYQPAKEIFTSVANLAPDKIVNELCLAADNWRGNANQEDDITFVVVKLKEK